MRRLRYGNDRSDRAMHVLTKQQISKKLLQKYNLDQIHVRGRIDTVEDNITSLTSGWDMNLIQIDDQLIAEEIFQLMKGQIVFQNTETCKLLNFISLNTPSFIPSLNTNKRKGDAILSRQTTYSGMKK